MPVSRRSFLKRTATLAAASPFLLPSHVWAAETKPNALLGMGFIGMGKQSRGLLGGFLGQDTQVLAVCDVDTTRRGDAKKRVEAFYAKQAGQSGRCAAYSDFREITNRKDIDAVCIATPDHWHTIITLAALKAGKDVYCEKPCSHNLWEGRQLVNAARKYGRMVQAGTQARANPERNCKDAVDRSLLLHISWSCDRNRQVFRIDVQSFCDRSYKKSDPPCICTCAKTQNRRDLKQFTYCPEARACFLFCLKRCQAANLHGCVPASCAQNKYVALDEFSCDLQGIDILTAIPKRGAAYKSHDTF